MSMKLPIWLLVACGGALGSSVRWLSELALDQITENWLLAIYGFDYSVLVINVLGSFAIGAFAVMHKHSVQIWSFWITGVFGGFTTFSMIMLNSYWHLLDSYLGLFILNLLGTILSCLLAVSLGMRIFEKKFEL